MVTLDDESEGLRMHLRRTTAGAACLAALLTALATGGPAETKPRPTKPKPNLGVVEVLGVPAEVQAGGRFAVKVLLGNHGTAAAPRTRLSLLLSRDTKPSGDDLAAGRARVPRIDSGGVKTVAAPAVAKASASGSYHVVACVKAGRQRNCQASRSTIRVLHPVNGVLSGTLDLYDSGELSLGASTTSWNRYVQTKISMGVSGRGTDIRVVDDSSSYSWLGDSTTTTSGSPECVTVRKDDEQLTGPFLVPGRTTSDLTGSASDPDLRSFRLTASMEYDVAGTLTSCNGTVPLQDHVEAVVVLELAQVSQSGGTTTYRVSGTFDSAGNRAPWDRIDGTLTFRSR